MIVQNIAAARFEQPEADEPWYGEIPGLRGVRATGRTGDECRARLSEALDGWLLVRLESAETANADASG